MERVLGSKRCEMVRTVQFRGVDSPEPEPAQEEARAGLDAETEAQIYAAVDRVPVEHAEDFDAVGPEDVAFRHVFFFLQCLSSHRW